MGRQAFKTISFHSLVMEASKNVDLFDFIMGEAHIKVHTILFMGYCT